jgi:2-keto-4-pentenoate hydratase
MIAAAGEPLEAGVVVAAGAEVVAVAGDPSMQRWSPSLVGLSGASF